MVGFLDATKSFLKGKLCESLDRLGDAITLAGKLTLAPAPPINVPNALGSLVCDRPPNNLQPPAPPFTGGQCATGYTVSSGPFTIRRVRCSDGAVLFSGAGVERGRASVAGPIKSISTKTVRSGNCGPTEILLECVNGNGVTLPVGTLGSTNSNGERIELVGLSPRVTRSDGLADNCGNPGPIYPAPGTGVPFSGPVTYNTDESTNITVNATGIFAPVYVSVNGSLRIPVTVNVGGVDLSGEIEISPDFTINLRPKGITSGPGKPDGGGGAPGQPQLPVPENVADVDPIIGVLVFSTLQSNEQNSTGLASVGGPSLHVPRIGSVQFAIKTGDSIGWTADLDVKNLESYVPCPAPQGAIAVRVTPIAGVTRTFTPVRGKALTSF